MANKKIGILTFHRAHNYGAVLQAYALQEYVASLGYDVSIVDYKPDWVINGYKWFRLRNFKKKNPLKIIKEFSLLTERKKRYNNFEDYINNKLALSSDLDTSQYDLIIVGSDQVWNTDITHGYDPYYWGDKQGRFITYAASVGKNSFSGEDKRIIIEKLKNFQQLALREKTTTDIFQSFTPAKIHTVLDPTLLVDSSFWTNQVTKNDTRSKYLLFYQIENIPGMIEFARKTASDLNLELKVLSASMSLYNSRECMNAAPQEYLDLFYNADFVLCTSFHGTAFSVIFNKPFYTIRKGTAKDERFLSLLRGLSLENRAIPFGDKVSFDDIEWAEVTDKLKNMRVESRIYIEQATANE